MNGPAGNRLALAGLALVAVLVALALGAPLLPLADPHAMDLARRLLPAGSPGHLLGTDQLGRDLLARLVWGTRASLAVGAVAVAAAALAGTLIGLVAVYGRGWIDTLSMRAIDVLLAFPYLLLALAIVAALGPGLTNAMIAVAVANVPFFARTVRGTVVELAARSFVDAARLAGAGPARILFGELLPKRAAGGGDPGLHQPGLDDPRDRGPELPGPGRAAAGGGPGQHAGQRPRVPDHRAAGGDAAGVAILLLVVGINLAGDGLRDLLDPRRRGGSALRPAPLAAPQPTAARADDALLRVEGLTVRFGDTLRAVDEVSFSLRAGERLGVVGESGCGKTVTALSLMGLAPPPGLVAGGIRFDGEDLLGAPPGRWRALRGARIAYIPQDPLTALDPVRTVGAQLVETLRAHRPMERGAARRRAVELLARVRIDQAQERVHAYPHQLSGGMRQRVLIAMALAFDPALIVADEPTTALDVTVQAEILGLMDALCREQGAALLFISHDLGVVARLCDRILVMYAGRVVETADAATLLSRPLHPYTRALLACAPELGRPHKRLAPIPGAPPSLDRLPAGCHFAPRCEFSQARCQRGAMDLRPWPDGRRVRCIRAEELKPWTMP